MIVKSHKNSQIYKITYILIALNLIFYIYGAIIGGSFFITDNSVIEVMGQVNWKILWLGFPYYYQLFSSMFIHASIVHLGGNMIFLLIFGLRSEEVFSLPEYLGIYLLGGLTGNLFSLLLGPGYISVGASGALFALFGACVIYDRKARQQSIIGALIFAAFLFIISMGRDVNILAHLCGLVFGLAAGYVLALRRASKKEEPYTINYSFFPF